MNDRMHMIEGVRMGFAIIRGNKMRSGLLILGVAIGVATLLAMYTIVSGLSGKIRSDIVSSAQPYLYIARYTGLGGEDMEAVMRRPQIMPECIGAMARIRGVECIDYMISGGGGTILHYGEHRTNIVQIFGASDQFATLYSFALGEGRNFTAAEVAGRRKVCVLGDGPRQTLFPKMDPVGQSLRLYGEEYLIVGAMETRRHVLGQMGDNFVAVPWTSFEKDFINRGEADRTLAVTVGEGWELDDVREDVIGELRKVRGLRPGEANDFEVIASETYGELVDQLTQGIALVLVVLSSIGLMVGGIGVMNIMLISVTERTREIGVRMAVGARRADVLRQVLVEAATLTSIGGVVGTGLGYLAAWGGTRMLHFPFRFDPLVALVAVLFSASIGIFFGIYPANRAARMDPVEALRHE